METKIFYLFWKPIVSLFDRQEGKNDGGEKKNWENNFALLLSTLDIYIYNYKYIYTKNTFAWLTVTFDLLRFPFSNQKKIGTSTWSGKDGLAMSFLVISFIFFWLKMKKEKEKKRHYKTRHVQLMIAINSTARGS